MPREFRDELPPLLRDWFDWSSDGLAGWSKAVPVAAWLLVGVALGLLAGLALVGHGLAAVYAHIAPRGDVVTLRRRA